MPRTLMLCENAGSIAQTATHERQCDRSSLYILSGISAVVAALSTISTLHYSHLIPRLRIRERAGRATID